MLQGRVPGLNITTSSGVPGNTASFNIRGTNSINGGSPLVLVDGVEGDLDRVNPNDIESISVIKDASAAAIYGGRASFGVILVTTKSGSSDGKVQISYSGRVGWNPLHLRITKTVVITMFLWLTSFTFPITGVAIPRIQKKT